ncbi:MAG: acyl-CoA desaturase [Acidobacteriota bacterium]
MPILQSISRWLDTRASSTPIVGGQVEWLRCLPFLAIHLLCAVAWWTGVTATAAAVAVVLFVGRMFAITGFYHRYFSHRAFKTSRVFQFLMAVAGNLAVQRGPIWWAAHHRHHHRHAEERSDLHSPVQHGFWRSHLLWFMTDAGFQTETRYVKDWLAFPELRILDRFDWAVPLALLSGLALAGLALERLAPGLGTNAAQLVVWGFAISTVAVYHATYTINSLAHRFGTRRYATRDDSRNNALLAILTLGEGWHNNHHHFPAAARQGFYWWEVDFTYYGLLALARLGLIWDLRTVPVRVLTRNLIHGHER